MYTQEEFKKKIKEWLEKVGAAPIDNWQLRPDACNADTVIISVSQIIGVTVPDNTTREAIEYFTAAKDNEKSMESAVKKLNELLTAKKDEVVNNGIEY